MRSRATFCASALDSPSGVSNGRRSTSLKKLEGIPTRDAGRARELRDVLGVGRAQANGLVGHTGHLNQRKALKGTTIQNTLLFREALLTVSRFFPVFFKEFFSTQGVSKNSRVLFSRGGRRAWRRGGAWTVAGARGARECAPSRSAAMRCSARTAPAI